jgi:ABC-2 type transport system ATP-binding protein
MTESVAAVCIEAKRATGRSLSSLDARFESGIHVVVGTPEGGARELVRFVAGVDTPRAGSIRVAGKDPYRSATLRRRIASVFDGDEELPPAETVEQAVAILLGARGSAASAGAALARFGLSSWASRRAASLDGGERRTIAMAVALGLSDLIALAIEEPLSALPGLRREAVLEALRQHAHSSAVIVCTTASLRDARELGATISVLARGRLSGVGAPGTTLPASPLGWAVRTPDARALFAALSSEPAVSAVQYDAALGPNAVFVRSRDEQAGALAIAKAAASHRIRSDAIEPLAPSRESGEPTAPGPRA